MIRKAIRTPQVYRDGLNLTRYDLVNGLGGSDQLRKLETLAFEAAVQDNEYIQPLIDSVKTSKNTPVGHELRDIGIMGATELVAKLGVFFFLIPEVDLYRSRG